MWLGVGLILIFRNFDILIPKYSNMNLSGVGWRSRLRKIGSLVENEKYFFIFASLPIPEP